MELRLFKWLIPNHFPPAMEEAYQSDLHKRLFSQVRYSIIAGMTITAIFTILDYMDRDMAPNLWKIRLILIALLLALVWYTRSKPEHASHYLDRVTIGMGAYALYGILILSAILMQGRVDHGVAADFVYMEIVASKTLVIIFVFGPLATPLAPAILLSVSSAVLVFLLGIYFSVSIALQIEGMFDLFGIVFMGALFRRQFEIYSRQEFVDKQHAEERRVAMEQVAQERVRFLRDTSHNLRQPVQALLAHNAALEMELNQLGVVVETMIPSAKMLFLSVDELRESFNKILSLSNLHDGHTQFNISNTAIHSLLNKVEVLYLPSARAKGIDLKVGMAKPCLWVQSDGDLLHQIIGNLVDNAVKYTRQGRVLVRATQIKNMIKVHVVDTGIGISEKHRANVFKPFYRVENTQSVSGTGVGLAFVKESLERLPGHRLHWSSNEGRGTHFCLKIPASMPPHHDDKPQESSLVKGVGKGKMILLVDDDQRLLDAMARPLSMLGYEIAKASSATEARLVLEGHSEEPDIVITDFQLFDETAEDVVRHLHNVCGPIPVIVLSGEVKASDTLSILGQECVFLNKPVKLAQLAQTITRLTG